MPSREGGFALVELIVATAVLTIGLTGIASVLGTQLVSVGASSAQQTANGLLTQAMEEVRALPFQYIVDGLSASDTTIATDPNISVSGTSPNQTYTYTPTGETIPVASPYSQTNCCGPFVPHISYETLSAIKFKLAAYPTIDAQQSGVYRVTIVVSWYPAHGVSSLSAQTLVYSPPGGCLTDTNHPYAAPCQPFFYAQSSSTSGGGLTVTGTVSGLGLAQVELFGPQASSSIQIEQTSSALGSVKTSEGDLNGSSVGGESATSSADNDPGTQSPVSQSNTTASQSGSQPLTLGDLLTTGLGVTPGLGDQGVTTSTVDASTSPACNDLSGEAQNTGLPCGSSTVTQTGLPAVITGALTAVGLPLVSLQPSSTSSFAAKYASSGASYCKATSGDGCAHAAASRSIGTLELAGLPTITGITDPVGWAAGSTNCPAGNYLVALVGYSDQVTAESGVGAAAPTGTLATSYLCFWNGTAYQSQAVSLGATPQAVSIPALSVGNPATAAVTITPTISFGQMSSSTNTPSGCGSPCTASSEITSPITGSIAVTVVVLGQTVASLSIGIDLGTLYASTSYQAAP